MDPASRRRGRHATDALASARDLLPGVRRHAQRVERHPGTFAAFGHDYRADLLDFVRTVYRLEAAPEQVASIREALPRFEAILFGYLDGAREAQRTVDDAPAPTAEN